MDANDFHTLIFENDISNDQYFIQQEVLEEIRIVNEEEEDVSENGQEMFTVVSQDPQQQHQSNFRSYVNWEQQARQQLTIQYPGINHENMKLKLGKILSGAEVAVHQKPIIRVKATKRPLTNKIIFVKKPDSCSTDVINLASNLILLAESMSAFGQQLPKAKSQISVPGCLSVLLDSFLCATTTLMGLTQFVDELKSDEGENNMRMALDSIHYYMPGLN